jgi:hypothetical protein
MKRLFLVILLIGIFIIGLGGYSGAFFSSTATSKDNILSTGGIDAVLTDANETKLVTISNSWTASGLLPGMQIPETTIKIRNNGVANAHHLDVKFSYTGSAELAKKIIFNSTNNGFRFGTGTSDNTSINLLTTLFGSTDVDYKIFQGLSGNSFTATTVDGADGTPRDSKISLSELAAADKIRFETGEEIGGIAAGTEAVLWINAYVDNSLTLQNESINITVAFTLDQDASQL